MTTFINAEYVIAKLFVEQAKLHRYKITLAEVCDYGIKLQREANNQNLDVVFLTATNQVKIALRDFADYFIYKCESDEIYLVHNKDMSDIEYHFIAYLPTKVAQLTILS